MDLKLYYEYFSNFLRFKGMSHIYLLRQKFKGIYEHLDKRIKEIFSRNYKYLKD